MTEISYLSEAHRRQKAFLSFLMAEGVEEDGVQRAAEMYPVEADEIGYSWNMPLDYQELAGIARLPLALAQKAYKEFEKLGF